MVYYVLAVVLLAILFQSAVAGLVEVSACEYLNLNVRREINISTITGDGAELPYQVDIANCTVQPCPLVRGSDAVLKIDFYARK